MNTEKKQKTIPPCRLFPIFAREAKIAVIFRRGPSKFTQLILWNTKTDEIINGQWFKGRIYERRCDLSPDGTKLIYFVSKINSKTLEDAEFTYAWTAISKPPYLTALALWAKGDCWHGGGLFQTNDIVFLNHKPEIAKPHKDHSPENLKILPNPDACGEDDPIYSQRMDRDGWKTIKEWKVTNSGYDTFYTTQQPETREKTYNSNRKSIQMERSINHLHYSEKFIVKNGQDDLFEINKKGCWADFDQNGRIAVFKDGKLFVDENKYEDKINLVELADFNVNKPDFAESPEWAKHW
jgi:hypothetical protein